MKIRNLTTFHLFAILSAVLLFGAGKCFGQYNSGDEKIIVVQRISPGPKQDSVKTYFRGYNKVRVVSSAYDKPVRGRILSISDSCFYIDDKLIRPAEIISINRCRGRTNMLTGASMLAGGGILLGFS